MSKFHKLARYCGKLSGMLFFMYCFFLGMGMFKGRKFGADMNLFAAFVITLFSLSIICFVIFIIGKLTSPKEVAPEVKEDAAIKDKWCL